MSYAYIYENEQFYIFNIYGNKISYRVSFNAIEQFWVLTNSVHYYINSKCYMWTMLTYIYNIIRYV